MERVAAWFRRVFLGERREKQESVQAAMMPGPKRITDVVRVTDRSFAAPHREQQPARRDPAEPLPDPFDEPEKAPTYLLPEGRPRGRFYGGDGTIHGTQHLDIEVSEDGVVLGVWYRCQMLAFEQHTWTPQRGVGIGQGSRITGVEVLDEPGYP